VTYTYVNMALLCNYSEVFLEQLVVTQKFPALYNDYTALQPRRPQLQSSVP